MEALVKFGRWAFAICLIGLAGQQLYYADLRPVFVPAWGTPIPGHTFLAYLFSIILIGTAVTLFLRKGGRMAMLALGGLLLAMFLFSYVPFELWVDPGGRNIGAWNNALKELAFSGSAFVIAGSYGRAGRPAGEKAGVEVSVPMGRIFYSIMLIVFGIEHFIYSEFVRSLVPAWIPGDLFWTYFAAVALIGAGVAIIFQVKVRLVGMLLGVMVFIWFLILHIPRAVVAPVTDMGNELSSVFESLGVSGVAFVIADGGQGLRKR
ncbi:MAG TPA: hypothetical protein VFE32_10465 [Puia sp.]|jgi:uncharacterized membrane protein YphA (DoxX/SURF4 family)|nr:hypothetical protein [Puia sp.]